MNKLQVFTVSLILTGVLASPLPAEQVTSVGVVKKYFDMLVTGNFETADMMWTPPSRDRADRFGIEYQGVPLKIDCASPIVLNLEKLVNYGMPPVKSYEDLPGGLWTRLKYAQAVDTQNVEHTFYTVRDGDWFWLAFPQDYHCRDWEVRESRFFRLHIHPDREPYVNETVLKEADRLLADLARSIDLSPPDLALIEEKKIEFFYCASDSDLVEITGQRTRGLVDLPSNDVISASFPHLHELTHLLVNIKLRQLPLYTLPLMSEGIAVHCGGRWGKNTEALMGLGVYLYREKLVELDSLLTIYGFGNSSGADIAYPVVGLFASYLLDRLESDRFFELYLSLSGDYGAVCALTVDQVKDAILAGLSMDNWTALIADFDRYISQLLLAGSALPGGMPDGRQVAGGNGFSVTSDADWLGCEFRGTDDGPIKGSLLFCRDEQLVGTRSALFEEQFGNRHPYEGYRYAVRYDENEAGLYDYVSNRLLAKYIWGIAPSDEYLDKENQTINIKFRAEILGDYKPSSTDFKILPE